MLICLVYGSSSLAACGPRALLLLDSLPGNRLTSLCRYLLSGVSSFSVGEVGSLLSCCASPFRVLQPLTCCFPTAGGSYSRHAVGLRGHRADRLTDLWILEM